MRRMRVLAATVICLVLLPPVVNAVTLQPGDIIVADGNAFGAGTGGIFRVDPGNGAATTIAVGAAPFFNFRGIAVAASGDLVVSYGGPGGGGVSGVARVSLATGAITNISSGGNFITPFGLAVASNGDIVVADESAGKIIRVSPQTGVQTIVAQGGNLSSPRAVAFTGTGQIVAVDFGLGGAVIKVDPTTGSQTLIAAGGNLLGPHGVFVDSTGGILVASTGSGAIIRVDPTTGAHSILSSQGALRIPIGVTEDATGRLLVADEGTRAIVAVDPTTGAQQVLAEDGDFVTPFGVAVVGGCRVTVAPPDDTSNQGDRGWAADPLDSTVLSVRKTIGNKGCALTSLGMALNFEGATDIPFTGGAILNTPGTLNEFMSKTDADFVKTRCKSNPNLVCGANVNWDPATADMSLDGLKFHYTKIRSDKKPREVTSYLREQLCQQHPVIVGVNLSAKGVPGHFVLVTGQDGSDFTIIDPAGGVTRRLIDTYGAAFETRGFVADPPGDISRLNFAVGDPAELLLIDPAGNMTGLAPSGEDVEAIPNSVYIRDALEDDVTGEAPTETAHILNVAQPPAGSYQLVVTGLYTAISDVSVRAFATDGTSQRAIVIPVILGPGSATTLAIQFAGSPGASPTVARSVSFQSTVADISNSFDLGLIDKREIARSLIDEIEEAARAAARGRFAKALEELSEFKKKVKHEAGRHVKGITPQVLLEDAEALIGQIPVTRRNDSERRGEMAEDEDRGQDRDQRGHGKAGDRDDRGDKRGPGRNGDEKQ